MTGSSLPLLPLVRCEVPAVPGVDQAVTLNGDAGDLTGAWTLTVHRSGPGSAVDWQVAATADADDTTLELAGTGAQWTSAIGEWLVLAHQGRPVLHGCVVVNEGASAGVEVTVSTGGGATVNVTTSGVTEARVGELIAEAIDGLPVGLGANTFTAPQTVEAPPVLTYADVLAGAEAEVHLLAEDANGPTVGLWSVIVDLTSIDAGFFTRAGTAVWLRGADGLPTGDIQVTYALDDSPAGAAMVIVPDLTVLSLAFGSTPAPLYIGVGTLGEHAATLAQVAPRHALIQAAQQHPALNGSSTWAPTPTVALGSGYATLGPGAAADDVSVSWDVILDTGTWELRYTRRKDADAASATISLDGEEIGVSDDYAATPALDEPAVFTGIVVPDPGRHTLTLSNPTRNDDSTGWALYPQTIDLRRTGP